MLVRITSGDNSRLKLVRKLGTRRGRSEEKRFAAEGRNLVREILSRGMDVDFIMVPDSLMDEKDSELSEMIGECVSSPGITLCAVSDREFSRITDAGTGIGMLAVVHMQERSPSLVSELSPDSNILVLDRIQDPGNMGTLIRTAAAAGYEAILAMSGTVDIYSPKVLRATAGMIFEVPVIYVKDAAELEGVLRGSGKRIAVTAVDGGIPYYDADLRTRTALVIGNEGRGVSSEIMSMADVRVTLPMKGSIESLNAGVAAAILMYEAVRG